APGADPDPRPLGRSRGRPQALDRDPQGRCAQCARARARARGGGGQGARRGSPRPGHARDRACPGRRWHLPGGAGIARAARRGARAKASLAARPGARARLAVYGGCMEIEPIAPANEDSTYVPALGMAVLAAHTPPSAHVHYTDDLLTPIDLERDLKPVDLVGITVTSKTARRGYDIAAAYRRRGVKVVLGGIHATALPEEAKQYADAVVVGEGEGLWEQVIADFGARRLQPFYRHQGWPSLAGLRFPRRAIFRSRKSIPFHSVQTTRGCPFPCEFCSVSTYNGGKFRFRPTGEVCAEIRALPRPIGLPKKLILFADDNVMIHERYSRELFEAMIP